MRFIAEFSFTEGNISEDSGNARSDINFRRRAPGKAIQIWSSKIPNVTCFVKCKMYG